MTDFRQDFFRFAASQRALLFGRFVTKAGRTSPYFFNAGMFSTGAALAQLAEFYAKAIRASGLQFDMMFGSAYKGIPLAAAVSMTLSRDGADNLPFAYNRKEAKSHGEGGNIVGRPLAGRVLIIDDVITAGTAIRESIDIIRAAGATPAGVALALDRQERGRDAAGNDLAESAVQEVQRLYDIPCISILTLTDLIDAIRQGGNGLPPEALGAMEAYRARYGSAKV